MIIRVNGDEVQTRENITLKEFVRQADFTIEPIVVERNNEIVKKENYDNVVLQEGDVLEIIRFVGGG